jgi:hypothetical protein
MKNLLFFGAWLILFLAVGCTGNHLIKEDEYRSKVDSSFKSAMEISATLKSEVSALLDKGLKMQEKEALEFLYAFMPLNDLSGYSPDFFLGNVNITLKAKADFPWSNSIPENVWLHYVLPVRINNENLDSFRIKYYDEIKARIQGKNLTDAALEINHWCHEKVTYQGSDSRTSAPESTILSARGRCGEESTFTVAALRTAGIPARQVYTPRWAHCDDNHAWVEFWNNGQWSYMGACEPEPLPDMGWFTEPARRAMLVNTRSFGAPSGNENITNNSGKFSIVNNLAKYAPAKRIFVRVTDNKGKPVSGAYVEFQLYNYAEFFPLATIPASKDGLCSFETGLGDLLVWARKNDDYAFAKISVSETDTLNLVPGNGPLPGYHEILDLSVPIKRAPYPGIPSELARANSQKLDEENRIRQKYIDSWPDRTEAVTFAVKHGYDSAMVAEQIKRSMGNFSQIFSFLESVPDSLRNEALELLAVIADKDLRDTKSAVLSDHLLNSRKLKGTGNEEFRDYVLNPRISDEIITQWRGWFIKNLPEALQMKAVEKPSLLISYIDSILKISDELNYAKTLISPDASMKLGISDRRSRSVCFVAAGRSLGIPSRLEPGSNLPQYFSKGIWHDVYFRGNIKGSEKRGYLKLVTSDKNPVPQYYKHFTIARFFGGRYNTLEYDEDKKVNDFGELQLIPGKYMLVTGNRIDDSNILSSLDFFEIMEGEHKKISVNLRKDDIKNKPLGTVNVTRLLTLMDDEMDKFKSMAGRNTILFWLESDKEPSKHVINDLLSVQRELTGKGAACLFYNVGGTSLSPEIKEKLPYNSLYGDDSDHDILKKEIHCTGLSLDIFPVVMFVNTNGEIIYLSQGYHIGTGEEILKLLNSAE